jgi:hypothetical protein
VGNVQEKSVTVPELATMLQIVPHDVFQLAAAGVLPHFRVSGVLQFDPDLIQEWLQRNDLLALIRNTRETTCTDYG